MIDAEWMTPPPEEEEELDLSFPPESLTCFTGSDNLKTVNCVSWGQILYYLNILNVYRVTIQLVTNLPVTSKQKFCFGLAWPSLARPKRNFLLKSAGGFGQRDGSPCTVNVCRKM